MPDCRPHGAANRHSARHGGDPSCHGGRDRGVLGQRTRQRLVRRGAHGRLCCGAERAGRPARADALAMPFGAVSGSTAIADAARFGSAFCCRSPALETVTSWRRATRGRRRAPRSVPRTLSRRDGVRGTFGSRASTAAREPTFDVFNTRDRSAVAPAQGNGDAARSMHVAGVFDVPHRCAVDRRRVRTRTPMTIARSTPLRRRRPRSATCGVPASRSTGDPDHPAAISCPRAHRASAAATSGGPESMARGAGSATVKRPRSASFRASPSDAAGIRRRHAQACQLRRGSLAVLRWRNASRPRPRAAASMPVIDARRAAGADASTGERAQRRDTRSTGGLGMRLGGTQRRGPASSTVGLLPWGWSCGSSAERAARCLGLRVPGLQVRERVERRPALVPARRRPLLEVEVAAEARPVSPT